MNKLDPNGNYWETLWDVVMVGWSTYDYLTADNPADRAMASAMLTADLIALVTPVPAGGPRVLGMTAETGAAVARSGRQNFTEQTKSELRQAGLANPGQHIHHIATSADNDAARAVRDMFEKHGLPMNHFNNGVGLTYHRGRHRESYDRAMRDRLAGKRTREEFLDELARIQREQKAIDDRISREIAAGNSSSIPGQRSGDGGPKTANAWAEDSRFGGLY